MCQLQRYLLPARFRGELRDCLKHVPVDRLSTRYLNPEWPVLSSLGVTAQDCSLRGKVL